MKLALTDKIEMVTRFGTFSLIKVCNVEDKVVDKWISKIQESYDTTRVSSLLTGMELDLAHDLDLTSFRKRLNEVVKWHENDHTEFSFPYFTLVQSSGMGKTRLLKEAKRAINEDKTNDDECVMIYCCGGTSAGLYQSEREKKVFDGELQVTESLNSYTAVKNAIANIPDVKPKLASYQRGKEQRGILFLLFDETQHLMKILGGTSVFRHVRWWLRDTSHRRVVAVFTGTSSRLTNCFPVKIPSSIGNSRDVGIMYYHLDEQTEHLKKLYDPFFLLSTVACLRKTVPVSDESTEFEASSLYGRPLFAAMYKEGELRADEGLDIPPQSPSQSSSNPTMKNRALLNISKRLCLGERLQEWLAQDHRDKAVTCSVVGTRVQLGVLTSSSVATRLVEESYSCLVDFQQGNGGISYARTCTIPDPVCAGLAMGLMDENWSIGYHIQVLEGVNKREWVKATAQVFSSGLCLPDKGDAGEVFAAMYMLFCGDELRRKKDPSLRTFSIPLDAWFERLKASKSAEPNLRTYPRSKGYPNDPAPSPSMEIGFIQVCRNYLRSDPFFEQEYLEYLYNSRTATYVYPNCMSIDIVASIKVIFENGVKYCPLLVSVKNCKSMTMAEAANGITSMKQYVEKVRNGARDKPKALCLLLVLGLSNRLELAEYSGSDISSFPFEDVYRCVQIEENDEYGIDDAIKSLGGRVESSEIYASHGYLMGLQSIDGCLRSKSEKKDVLEEMHTKLRQIQQG